MQDVIVKRILVVEDNPVYRKMIRVRLEANGYQALTAESGLEGLNIARREKPDLILLDLLLPGMDGHTVCRLLKYDQMYRDIPIVMLTSRDLDDEEEKASRCGADAFIVKATRAEIILDVIQKLLEKTAA